ncbi:MAG: DHH family phosphoesterase [Caldilineales bacterium]
MIVIQDFPDPDAIASAYAHQLISSRFDIQTEIVYAEQISHLQNIALVKLLNIATTRFDPSMDLSRFDGAVFIDTQGTTSAGILEALEDAAVPAVIVVDHHEPQDRIEPEFSDIRRIGAAATMFAQYIEQGALQFDKSQREHVAVATALLHGILTDTNGFIRAGEEDFAAAGYLSRLRDSDLLQQVMTQGAPS